jgi:hypothetical protein
MLSLLTRRRNELLSRELFLYVDKLKYVELYCMMNYNRY